MAFPSILLAIASAEGYETWFINYLDTEQTATVLRTWEPLVIPGLLQTEAYARQVIDGANPGSSEPDVEPRVAARMARQQCGFGDRHAAQFHQAFEVTAHGSPAPPCAPYSSMDAGSSR